MRLERYLRFFFSVLLALVASLVPVLVLGQSQPPTHMTPYLNKINGVVVDETGQPIEGALVTWRDHFQTTTDQQGRFRFDEPVLSFSGELDVAHPGYVFHENVVFSDEEQAITLQEGISVAGRVTDAKGQGIAGVSVAPFGFRRTFPERMKPWVVVTDAEGRFLLRHATAEAACRLTLYKPGVIDQSLDWADESVPVPHASNRHSMTRYIRDDFTFQVDGMCRTKLEVVDARTGQTVEISRVGIKKHVGRTPRLNQNLIRSLKLGDPQADHPFTNLDTGTWRIFVFPEEDAGLMGGFVDVVVQADTTEVNPEIELHAGRVLGGSVVDARSGDPVPNAMIRYIPDDVQQIEKLGVVPDLEVRTDASGQFSIHVPGIAGELRLDRKVPGYVTLSDWEKSASEVRQPFAFRIAPESSPSEIRFELEPAPVARFRVVDEHGNPVAGVAFAGMIAPHRHIATAEMGATNDRGEFELQQLFDDCQYDYTRPDEKKHRVIESGVRDPEIVFQRRVFCWDPRNGMCAVIRVFPDELISGDRIEIRLKEGRTATGRIVDQVTDQPIGNAIVKVRSLLGAEWSTGADGDGRFAVTGLFPDLDYYVSHFRTGLEFDPQPFRMTESETSIDLGDVKVIDRNSPALKFAVPAVGELETGDGLNKLVGFAEEQMTKAPDLGRTMLSEGPRGKYQYRLAVAMEDQVNDLLKRTTDVNRGASVRISLLKSVEYSELLGSEWTNRVGWIEDSMRFLAENIDQPGVFDEFRHIVRRMHPNLRYHHIIFEHSSKPQIRGWAYLKVLNRRSFEVAAHCRGGQLTDAEFEARLLQLEEFWKLGLGELGEVNVPVEGAAEPRSQQIREAVVGSMNRAILVTGTLGESDETRVEKLKALCERLIRDK